MTSRLRLFEAIHDQLSAGHYGAAADLLLEAAGTELGQGEDDEPNVRTRRLKLWFAQVEALRMAGRLAEVARVLFDSSGGSEDRDTLSAALHLLASCYYLAELHRWAELDDSIAELEAMDRQLKGQIRAGVLTASAMVAQEAGETDTAFDLLTRAWTHDRSLGGYCPVQLACEIALNRASIGESSIAVDWLDATAELADQKSCCLVRHRCAGLVIELTTPDLVADRELARALMQEATQLECPSLRMWVIAVAVRTLLCESEPAEFGEIEIVCEDAIRHLLSSESALHVRFDSALLRVDVALALALGDRGKLVFRLEREGLVPHLAFYEDAKAKRVELGTREDMLPLVDKALREANAASGDRRSDWRQHLVRRRMDLVAKGGGGS